MRNAALMMGIAAVMFAVAGGAADSKKPAFNAEAGLKAAPAPKPATAEDTPKKEVSPHMSYAVSQFPNVGIFYLEGDNGTCLYTWPLVDNLGKVTYLMYEAKLKFVGSDTSGLYWHYRFPLAGGLNWFFPKRTDTPWLPTVWHMTAGPGSKPQPYGTPVIFPTLVPLAK